MLTKSQKHGLSPEIHTEYNLITINYWLLQISGPQILIYSPGTFFAPEQSPRGLCCLLWQNAGHMHRDRKLHQSSLHKPGIYSFPVTSHTVPGQNCYGCNQGMRSKIWFVAHFSPEQNHTTSVPVPPWFGRGWAKRRGVVNLVPPARVAILNELARLKMSILHTCTEKKVLLLCMAHGFYTKTLLI